MKKKFMDDPERFRYRQPRRPSPEGGPMPPRHQLGEQFLKGPIPWNWLKLAARQPGRALHVAIILWLIANMTKKATVRLSGKRLRELGVDRNAAYRGLKRLEEARLVEVSRHVGRQPIVTLRTAPSAESPSPSFVDADPGELREEVPDETDE
ncbi:MAG: hypothetical protein RJB38_581 [Pseudomonadota bacterium]|jgi:DNA-binding transcriptional ArsR family regulator